MIERFVWIGIAALLLAQQVRGFNDPKCKTKGGTTGEKAACVVTA